MPDDDRAQVKVRFEPPVAKQLKMLALELDRSVSDLVNEAVREWWMAHVR